MVVDPNFRVFTKFGIRNDLYNIRIQNGIIKMLRVLLWRLTVLNLRILLFKKSAKFTTLKVNTLSSLSVLAFYPKIESL